MIKELRERTGVGMSDCKNALVETDGDMEKAAELLREKGLAAANKKAGRIASEGMVYALSDMVGNCGVVVEVNSETDFVAKNEEFIALTQQILDAAIENKPETLDDLLKVELPNGTVQQLIMDKIGATGEKMELGYFEHITAPSVVSYIHMGNKLATIVGFNKENVTENVAKDVAMQIAAMNPLGVDESTIPSETIEREKAIAIEQVKAEGKPAEMAEKIAMGKLNKFFKENTLLAQAFVKDANKSVADYLKSIDADLKVTEFKRVALG